MAIQGIADTLQTAAPAAPSGAPAERVPARAPAPSKPDMTQLADAVDRANRAMADRNVHFRVDRDTGKTVVQVIDSDTGSVVRQLPTEEMLQIAKALDRVQGLMLRLKA